MKRCLFLLVSILFTFTLSAVNRIALTDATLHPNDTVVMTVDISNDVPMIAFQFDVYLPEGLKIAQIYDAVDGDTLYDAALTERKDPSHTLTVSNLGGKVRFLSYSMTNAYFKDGESTAVVTLKLVADSQIAQGIHPIYIKDAIYTQGGNEAVTVNLSDFTSTVTAIYRYPIALTAGNGGSVDGAGTYDHGDTVRVTASPSTGYSFLGWYSNEQVVSVSQNYSFKAIAAVSLTAKFVLNSYAVALTAGNGGTVNGAGTFNHGDSVRVTASPSTGYSFIGWYSNEQVVSVSQNYSFKATAAVSLTAKFALNSYAVALTAGNGGTVNGAGTFNHGDSVRVTASPSTGYSFLGWYSNEQVISTSQNYSFKATAAVSLTAKFALNSYAVTLTTGNGGTVNGAGTFNHGDSVHVSASPSTGYSFLGWYSNEQVVSVSQNYSFKAIAAVSLTAKFVLNNYAIDLTAGNGGTVNGAGTFNHGDSVHVTASPSTGYSFLGWYSNEQVVSVSQNYSFKAIAAVSLTAKFVLNNYAIDLTAGNGGTVNGAGTFNHGDSVHVTASPSTGYSFLGWYSNEQVISTSQNYSFKATAAVSLTAKFVLNSYAIALTAENGGTVNGAGTFNHGDSVHVSASPSTGYSFIGWYSNEQVVSVSQNYSFKATASTSLTAKFVLNSYAIDLTAENGGAVNGAGTFNHGDSVRVTASPSTGYSFVGWYSNEQVVSTNASYTFNATAAVSLTAKFALNSYAVTLTTENGGTVNGAGTFNHGDSVRVTASPSTGYSFIGWYSNEQVVSVSQNYSFKATAAVSLTAKFALNSYAVALTAGNGGTVNGAGTFNHGDSVRVTASPSTGYSFLGWYSNEQVVSTNASYTFNATAAVSLTAKFALNSYAVTLTTENGGTVNGAGTFNHGDSVHVTASPSTGYSFLGWYSNEQVVSTNASYTFNATSAVSLTAKFALNSYSVALTAGNGGTVNGAGSFNHGDSVRVTASPSTGYSFLGWYSNEQVVSTSQNYSFKVIAAVSLTAKFALNSYAVALTAGNGGSVNGAGTFNHGDSVHVTASPSTGYSFLGWYSNEQVISTSQNYSFKATASTSLTAKFALNSYAVILTAGNGGTVNGAGTFNHGDSVRVTASPLTGYSFVGWYSNEQVVSTSQNYSFKVIAAVSLTTKFALNSYAVTLTTENGGTVNGAGTFNHGDSVRVTASPSTGYSFVGWYSNEQVVSTSQNYSFKVIAAVSLTAKFALNSYAVTLTAGNGGTVNGTGTFNHGDTVTVVAVPSTGFSFIAWFDGETRLSSDEKYTFVLTQSRSLVATFLPILKVPTIDIINGEMTITNETEGTSIYYTLDTSIPTATSVLYEAPVKLSFSYIIKAFASKNGYGNSEIATAYYTTYKHDTVYSTLYDTTYIAKIDTIYNNQIDTVYLGGIPATPCIYIDGQVVTITCETEGAKIYYSTGNSTKIDLLYTNPFEVLPGTTIIAKAIIESSLANINYSFKATTALLLNAKFALNSYAVTLTAGNGGTVNGAGTFNYGDTVTVVAVPSTGFSFIAWFDGETRLSSDEKYTFVLTQSRSLVATFLPILKVPTIDIINGEMTITNETEGTSIYYTLDNSIPTATSVLYESPVKLSFSYIIKAFASKNGYGNSEIATAYYTAYKHDTVFSTLYDTTYITKIDTLYNSQIDTVYLGGIPATPCIYIDGQTVTITCDTEGTKIYYSMGSSTNIDLLYTNPFEALPGTTIIAKAIIESALATSSVPTGIKNLTKKVLSQRYYQESGVETKSLQPGINIIQSLYDDGSRDVIKVYMK